MECPKCKATIHLQVAELKVEVTKIVFHQQIPSVDIIIGCPECGEDVYTSQIIDEDFDIID